MTIAVVDYGIGNLGSILGMLKRVGGTASVTREPAEILRAERLILPGVGAFDTGMAHLEELGLIEPLVQKALVERVPVLGLCLGMQLLFERSEEGLRPGLGWIPGNVIRFRLDPADRLHRVPHMGWNTIEVQRPDPLVTDLGDGSRFYFAHSFHVVPADPGDVLGISRYGYDFASIIGRDNIRGAQCHPEKSHRFGLRVLANFVAL